MTNTELVAQVLIYIFDGKCKTDLLTQYAFKAHVKFQSQDYYEPLTLFCTFQFQSCFT